MFKKLKEKITEEVKSSPQRIQQFTQSVSDRLQNSAPSDENFFSIGEDDSNTSASASVEPGFSNVSLMSSSPQDPKVTQRRTSTSSIASDVSFLPRYDSIANMYHLQSDLDISASELEDNASNSSSQLGHLSKEQIYTAFRKSQMRYHKYRGRYTDLAKHYKDLEREIVKMKSVLVETQDKAIRRVTELKEQCQLEQKAKAHLEGALRDEIDEKQLKIEALETKIGLLRNGAPNHENGQQNGTDLTNLTKYLHEARSEIETLNARLQELKANAIVYQAKEEEYRAKIAAFSERERENNLSLAQTKMELHNELLSKEAELANYKQDNDVLRQSLEAYEGDKMSTRLENLHSQNRKLIEKLEAQTARIQSHEQDLIKLEQQKIEIEQLKTDNGRAEARLAEVQSEARRGLVDLEAKIVEKLREEYDQRENTLKSQLGAIVEGDRLESVKIGEMRHVIDDLRSELAKMRAKYKDLEDNHMELMAEANELRSCNFGELESKWRELEQDYVDMKSSNEELKTKLRIFEEKDVAVELDKTEAKLLEVKLQKMEEERVELLQQFENERKMYEAIRIDHSDLKEVEMRLKICQEHEAQLECELGNLREHVDKQNFEFRALENDKYKLEATLRKAEERLRIFEEKDEAIDLENTESRLLELKLQKLEEEMRNFVETFEKESKLQAKLLEERVHEVSTLKNELKHLESDFKEKDTELNDLKRCLAEKNELISSLQAEFEHSQQEFELRGNIYDDDRLKLVAETYTLTSHLEDVSNSLRIKEHELAEQSELVASLQGQIQHSRSELDGERIKSEEEERKWNSQLQQALDECQNVNRAFAEGQIEKLRNDFDNARAKHEAERLELTSQLEKALTERQKVTEELENAQQDIGELRRGLAEQSELVSSLRGQIERSRSDCDDDRMKIEDERVRLTSQLESASGSLRIREGEYSRLLAESSEQIKSLQAKYDLVSLQLEKIENFIKIITQSESIRDLESEFDKIIELLTKSKEIESDKLKLESKIEVLMVNESKYANSIEELEKRISQINSDNKYLTDENNNLCLELEEAKLSLESGRCDKIELETKLAELSLRAENDEIRTKFDDLLCDNENLRQDVVRVNLQLAEMEKHVNELQHEKQLLHDEIEELKTSPVNVTHDHLTPSNEELDGLRDKLAQYKSLDLTNRKSIEFYENELDKLKNVNEKLNRKLDETIVTLNHCTELSSSSTEIEYLRNVLYNYMLGKEGLVLARVIAAVCKFDQQQTDAVLAKEQQKQTLLGHLGIL